MEFLHITVENAHGLSSDLVRMSKLAPTPAYIGATRDMKKEKLLPERCRLRQSQYMNNLIEQDHRFMKWQIRPRLGFGSYETACKTIQGFEVMKMIRKGQMEGIEKGNIRAQNQFISELFGLVA